MAEFGIYIDGYTSKITDGGTDGALVTDGNPIQVILPLGKQTFKFIKFALRAAEGFKITEVQMYMTGYNAAAWFIKEYVEGETEDNLEMSNKFSTSYYNMSADFGSTNKLFWFAVGVNPTETEHVDSNKLYVRCKCETVE